MSFTVCTCKLNNWSHYSIILKQKKLKVVGQWICFFLIFQPSKTTLRLVESLIIGNEKNLFELEAHYVVLKSLALA